MKILITEDHAVVRQGLRLILADKFKKATFGEARNATEALERVWKEKWDVVVLDLTMPGRSGLEVLKKIKEDRRTRIIPVVLLTSSKEEEDVYRGYELGVSSYVVKPVDFDQVGPVHHAKGTAAQAAGDVVDAFSGRPALLARHSRILGKGSRIVRSSMAPSLGPAGSP